MKGLSLWPPPPEDHSLIWKPCPPAVIQWSWIYLPDFPQYLKLPTLLGMSILHIISSPQEREQNNRCLKNTLVNMSQELHLDWVQLLSLALLKLWALPKWPLTISPFELMYGWPSLTPGLSAKPSLLPVHLLTPLLCHLCSLLWNFTEKYSLAQPWTNPSPSPNSFSNQVHFSGIKN